MSQQITTSVSKKELYFYVDDSGSRKPDRSPTAKSERANWFALGGVIVDPADKKFIEKRMDEFRAAWSRMGDAPLHSYEIRNKTDKFAWLNELDAKGQQRFYKDLVRLIEELPFIALACVVDREGYNSRYQAQYGEARWNLCQTAFHIAVERAAKYALFSQARLRVFVEASEKITEARLRGYFDCMRADGQPFDSERSSKHQPLSQLQLRIALFEFRVKTKQSHLMQLADLILWPICQGGYKTPHRAYAHLVKCGKLLDSRCSEENGLLGVKYSCFG